MTPGSPRPDSSPPGAPRVPRIPRGLLHRFLPFHLREAVLGDLEEAFRRRVTERGRAAAGRWYWRMAFASLVSVWMDGGAARSLAADLRFVLRRAVRHPGTTTLVVLPLALALGSASTVYTLGRASLGGRVPGVEAPEELRLLEFRDADGASQRLSIPDVQPLLEAVRDRIALAPYNTTGLDVALPGRPARAVRGIGALAPYFELLALEARVGRLLTPEELDPSWPTPRIVISEHLWGELFDRSPGAVGSTLHVNGHPMQVVGVVADFHGLLYGSRQDVWFNAGDFARLDGGSTPSATDRLDARFFQLLTRPAADVRLPAIEERLGAVYRRVLADHPNARSYLDKAPRFTREGIGHHAPTRERARSLLAALAGGAGAIFFMGLANAALLLLHRGLAARGQVAVRKALGASRGRLIRQHVLEGTVLAAVAGAIGVGMAAAAGPALSRGVLRGLVPTGTGSPDAVVVAVTLALAFLGASLFAGAPAWIASGWKRPTGGRGDVGDTRAGSLVRAGLTATQVALSVTLLIGSLLLLRTLRHLSAVDVGMELGGLTAYQVNPDRIGLDRAETDALSRLLEARLRSDAPGIRVSRAALPPVGGARYLFLVRTAVGAGEPVRASVQWVDHTYFELLEIPVVRGRAFRATEVDAAGAGALPMIVSRSLAGALPGSGEGLDRRLSYDFRGETVQGPVVGVVDDVRTDLTGPARPTLYLPLHARSGTPFTLLVHRGSLAPDALDRRVVEAVSLAAPGLSVSADRISEWQRGVASRSRGMGWLLGLAALVALVLAGLGLYGSLAYTVSTRRRELGIRMALGGRGLTIVRGILVRVGATTALGVVAGLGGALLLSSVLESLLVGVERTDPRSVTIGVTVLVVVVGLAAAVPLLRASRVDPAETLRLEEA